MHRDALPRRQGQRSGKRGQPMDCRVTGNTETTQLRKVLPASLGWQTSGLPTNQTLRNPWAFIVTDPTGILRSAVRSNSNSEHY
jgi:hypothetical protein